MSTEQERGEQDGWSDSDRKWYEELTAQGHADGAGAAQARMLREAMREGETRMLESESLKPLLSDRANREGLERLKQQLRADGVLKTPARRVWWQWWSRNESNAPRSPARWAVPGGFALAAVVLGLMVVPPMLQPPPDYDEPPVMRGENVSVERTDANPRKAAETLVESLRQAGLKAKVYQSGKVYVVDMALAPDELAAAEPALRPFDLKPKAGVVRIKINRK